MGHCPPSPNKLFWREQYQFFAIFKTKSSETKEVIAASQPPPLPYFYQGIGFWQSSLIKITTFFLKHPGLIVIDNRSFSLDLYICTQHKCTLSSHMHAFICLWELKLFNTQSYIESRQELICLFPFENF